MFTLLCQRSNMAACTRRARELMGLLRILRNLPQNESMLLLPIAKSMLVDNNRRMLMTRCLKPPPALWSIIEHTDSCLWLILKIFLRKTFYFFMSRVSVDVCHETRVRWTSKIHPSDQTCFHRQSTRRGINPTVRLCTVLLMKCI